MKEERLTPNEKQTDHTPLNSPTSKDVKSSETDVISDFLKIDNCSILKYGIKPSTEPISYGYCITCDINLIHPICSECLTVCHINFNHTVKQIATKGNIICGCGERMHKFSEKLIKQDSIISSSCPYTDYCKTANLESWFIVGTKTVCPMCYINCGHQGKGFSVDIEQLKGEKCQCEYLNGGVTHTDLKEIYRKMDHITKKNNIVMEEIGPIKILNMLFLGKLSYHKLYSNFDEMLDEFNPTKFEHFYEIKDNFLETNFFLALKNFTKIAKKIKNAPLRYFCKAIINTISFDLIEQVVKNVIFKDIKQYWRFMDRLFYLYKKVGVGHLTRTLDKYKIYDLENLSVMQRKCLFYINQTLFPTATDQIDFFTRLMKLYLSKGISHLEGYDVIIQICSILKRLSEFYLFSSKQMILFCFEFEKTFEYFKTIKNNSRQLQLYFVVIKMLHYFLYCYNDEMIYSYISQKENNNNNNESEIKIPFIFTKNELGRLISRNVIRMMYFCFIGTKNEQLSQKETKTKKRILRHGLRIITYLISPKDCYMLSANKMINNGVMYYNIIQIPLNDSIYLKVIGEQKKIEDYYELYFIFKVYEEELLFEASNSLKVIMELSQEQDIRPLILKSNYFFTITKIFKIISFIPDNDSDRNFIKLYFSFAYYFTQNNSDYALLLMSHYTLSSILSIPILFVEDILSFYNHCTELIVNNDKVIAFSKHMIKLLFSYLSKVKKENMNLIKEHPNEEENFDMDELVSLFLKIMIKLILKTKQLNNKITIKVSKKVIIKFLNIFDFEELTNQNVKFLLLLINAVFDSSSENDRKDLNSLINNDTLIKRLKDYAIDLDYRIEILRYLKKFKFSIYYTQNFDTPQIIATNSDSLNTSMSNEKTEQRNYEYLNVFDGDKNNFPNFNQNPLVSNYQYPIKNLTMFYNMITINSNFDSTPIRYSSSKNIITYILNELFILEKEIMHLKDIYQKYSSNMPKFMNYFAKGLVTPLCVVVKKLFSFTHLCDGNSILHLYNMTMKFLYLKNYFFNLGESFTQNLIGINIPNFNVELFLNKAHQQETLDDYFEMKDGTKFSPFDYTRLYIILERHLFSFLSYPPSLKLNENFGNENYEALCSEYISSGEIDLNYSVQKTIESVNTKEKLFYQNIYSSQSNKLLVTTLNTMENQKVLNLEDENENKTFLPVSNKKSGEGLQKKFTQIYINYLKTKIQLDAEKSSLFVSFPEICIEYEKNFRKMLVSILINLSGIHDQYSSECYMILYKMLFIETGETQMDIMETMGGEFAERLGFLSKFAEVLYSKIVKILISDLSVEPTYNESTQITAFNVIKILKYLCEEHNNFFQEKILLKVNYKYEAWTLYEVSGKLERGTEEASMTFFNFMINVLTKILLITNKAKEEAHVAFYYDLIYGIVELLIEIIQGNKKEIISKKEKMSMKEMVNNENSLETFKNFVQIVADVLFDDSMYIGNHFKVRVLLISFFISILEEKTNEDLQKIIMKFLTLNRILSSIMITLKNYFYAHTRDDPKFAYYYINYSEKDILQRQFKFDSTLYNFFKEEYFHTNFSKNSEEFMLANNYYRYIKLLSLEDRLPEAYSLINQVENINEYEAKKKFVLFNKKFIKSNQITPINLVNEKEKSINIQFIEQYYVIKFFEYITRVVEVRLVEEKRRQLVIFTVPSEMIYLSEMTKTEFEHNVNRTSETSKKSELLKNVPLFQKEINYYKKRKLNCFTKMISRLDYIYVQIFVYLYAVIFNILMIVTLQGYKEIEENSTADTRRNLRELLTPSSKIENGIDLSIDDWGMIYDTLAYVFVVLNGILIISWVFIKMPLYYRLDRLKFMEEHKISSKTELTIWNKLQIAVVDTILSRDYINSLIFMFVLGLVGAIMKRGEIIYAFFLLAIIDLNPTLKNMILSIRMRYNELAASGLLMIVLVYFYTNIGFFFFNEDYAGEIETGIQDNYCKSLVFCFLTNIDAGIRARGGAADQMIRVSFERNFGHYVKRIFFDVTYFLICIIIMIDLVFGIIIGTFSEMRSEEIKHLIDKESHCFICHVTREIAEKNNKEDFAHHREVSHNLWNYVDYMIFLKFSDLHDLNAANTFARINLDAKNICFLPSSKDYNDENEEKEKGKAKPKIMVKEESSESSGSDSIMEKEEEYEEEEGEDGVVLITKSNESNAKEEFVLKLQ